MKRKFKWAGVLSIAFLAAVINIKSKNSEPKAYHFDLGRSIAGISNTGDAGGSGVEQNTEQEKDEVVDTQVTEGEEVDVIETQNTEDEEVEIVAEVTQEEVTEENNEEDEETVSVHELLRQQRTEFNNYRCKVDAGMQDLMGSMKDLLAKEMQMSQVLQQFSFMMLMNNIQNRYDSIFQAHQLGSMFTSMGQFIGPFQNNYNISYNFLGGLGQSPANQFSSSQGYDLNAATANTNFAQDWTNPFSSQFGNLFFTANIDKPYSNIITNERSAGLDQFEVIANAESRGPDSENEETTVDSDVEVESVEELIAPVIE